MPIRTAACGYALIALLSLLLVVTPALERAERAVLSAQFAVLRALWPREVANDVLVVGIDEETLKRLPEPLSLWHPHFARFLHATAMGGAAAVAVDVVFPDRSYDAIVPGYDKQLVTGVLAARRAAPLVIARTIDPAGEPRALYPMLMAAAGPEGSAFALLPIDEDGVVRRFHEHFGASGERVPTLAGELARHLGKPPQSGLIDYYRGGLFNYVPLQQVLALYEAGDTAKLKTLFAGKPVLLGGVFKFEDRLGAPVNMIAWDPGAINVPGVVLHAQAVRNMLNGGFIATVPTWVTVAVCLVLALAWWLAATMRRALLLAIAGFAVIGALCTVVLARGWHLPLSPALATLVIAVGGRTAREAAAGMHERRKLQRAFSGYVSPAVMDDILSGQIPAELGGVNRFLCALFSDIRGYTTRSEGMSPQQIVSFLNSYFEQVVNLIHARGGTVVTFMGDGIMAVFGAPKSLANPCANAFGAAREILAYVSEFNAQSQRQGEAPIDIGIGLHAGDAVVGHVGSSSRHDYTAIGDVINVASRLEGVTKEVGFRLVYSKTVADALAPADVGIDLGVQQIKGHSPIEAYGYDRIVEH